MNCTNARKLVDAYLDSALPTVEANRLAQHHAECIECRTELEAARALQERLRRLPAPSPPLGFEARVLRKAAQSHRPAFRWPRLRIATLAVAASLALALGLGLLLSVPQPEWVSPTSPGSMAQASQTVRLVFKAPKALTGARLRIELPPGVEVAAHPGQRVLEWTTNLVQGPNLLELPVVGESREPLIATLAYGRSERRFSAPMPRRPDLTGLDPNSGEEDFHYA